jgi:hypothetical protein
MVLLSSLSELQNFGSASVLSLSIDSSVQALNSATVSPSQVFAASWNVSQASVKEG